MTDEHDVAARGLLPCSTWSCRTGAAHVADCPANYRDAVAALLRKQAVIHALPPKLPAGDYLVRYTSDGTLTYIGPAEGDEG